MEVNIFLYGLIFVATTYLLFKVIDFVAEKFVSSVFGITQQKIDEGEINRQVVLLFEIASYSLIVISAFCTYYILEANGIITQYQLPDSWEKKIEETKNKTKAIKIIALDKNDEPLYNAEVKVFNDSSEIPVVKFTDIEGTAVITDFSIIPSRYKIEKGCLTSEMDFKPLNFNKYDTIVYKIGLTGHDTSVRFVNKTQYHLELYEVNKNNKFSTRTFASLPPYEVSIDGNYGKAQFKKDLSVGNHKFKVKQASKCDDEGLTGFLGITKCSVVEISCHLTDCEYMTVFISEEGGDLTYKMK